MENNIFGSEEALITEFTRTNTPGAARMEIYKFLEAAGVTLSERQHKILRGLIKHYKNVCTTQLNEELQEKGNEIHILKIKLGEIEPK